MTATERTRWRDQEMSIRHRRWGFNSPSADLDFLLVEYSLGEPVALVEYKHEKASPPDLEHPTYRALRALADASAIPFLVCRYWPGRWAFEVHSVNEAARAAFGERQPLSEIEYVTALHDLRSLTVQEAVLRHLNVERPPTDAVPDNVLPLSLASRPIR